jgi:aryl-alcohol dehydrogenase-like predicted oxidoreductase
MMQTFDSTTFGQNRQPVHRLGFSATYRPGLDIVRQAIDEGINYFFCYGFDSQTVRTLREAFRTQRERLIVATGAYNLLITHTDIRRTLEKRLHQLGTDYIDVFQFLGVTQPKHLPPAIVEELARLREEGKVRAIGMSCHHRPFAGEVAANGTLDMLMIRYNAAHRGAEQDIFPYLEAHHPFLVSYTATRWRQLTMRPRGYPKTERIPDAGLCYRFVLSHPNVDVCLMAPSNRKHFEANMAAVRQGPLPEDEMEFMRRFGDIVHERSKTFF